MSRNEEVANVAREACKGGPLRDPVTGKMLEPFDLFTPGSLRAQLTSMMCWDAVLECAVRGGISKWAAQQMTPQAARWSRFIPLAAPAIRTGAEMRELPAGPFIGFFEQAGGCEMEQKLIHAMISLGDGKAAGTKNGCIGIGEATGWEELDLAGRLNWGGNASFTVGTRSIYVRFRDLDNDPLVANRVPPDPPR